MIDKYKLYIFKVYKCDDLMYVYIVSWLPQTGKLTYPSSHGYSLVFLVRPIKIDSLSKFQVYNTVLLTIIMQSIRCPELTYLLTEYFNPFFEGQFCQTEYSWLANFSFTRKIYHPICSWPTRVMPKNPLIAFWGCFVCGELFSVILLSRVSFGLWLLTICITCSKVTLFGVLLASSGYPYPF